MYYKCIFPCQQGKDDGDSEDDDDDGEEDDDEGEEDDGK